MKKYSVLFLMAALACAACSRTEIDEPVSSASDPEETIVPHGLTFKATWEAPETPAGTKTSLGENGLDVLWMKNDALSVFDGNGEAYTPSSGSFAEGFVKDTRYQAYEVSEDKKTASFTVSEGSQAAAEGKPIYWAFTPRIQDAAVNFTDGKLIAWLTRYQRGNNGNFSEHRGTVGRYLNFAVGSTTNPENEPIVFKNILCHLKFVIPADMDGKITRIGVHTGSGEYLSGDQYVDLTGEKPSTSLRYNVGEYKSGSRYTDMYLFPDHGTGNNDVITTGQTFAAGTYYMAIMPCELKAGLFVTFDTAEGNTYSIDHYAVSTKFLRNKVYNMGEMTYNRPASATGTAVTLPYALSFLQAQESNGNMTFSDKGSLVKGTAQTGFGGNTFTMSSGTIATDKTYNVALSVQTTVGLGAKNWDSATYLAYWCNNDGHDPVLTGCFSNRTAQADLPFENYFKISIPLGENLPETFKVSFGIIGRAITWGLRDWKLYYSNDNKVWGEAEEVINLNEVQASDNGKVYNSNYLFATCTVHPEYSFHSGEMLYLKLMPYGDYVMNCTSNVPGGNRSANGLPGSGNIGGTSSGVVGLHSCVAVYDPSVAPSSTPSGAVFYEGFDNVSGGVDYFLGGRGERKRLAGMASLCGDAISLSGYTISQCYARPGYAQIGYLKTKGGSSVEGNAIGSLTTPALGSAGDLTLSFKAAAFENPACDRSGSNEKVADNKTPDETAITVTILNGGTIDGETTIQIDNLDTEAWQTITKTIVGATASTKIQFSSPSTGTYHRWFLDDICIK